MTQSIALQDLLVAAGHELVAVMIGKSPRREIPGFYYAKIKAPISTFESPNFILDKGGRSIKVFSSISHNLKKNKTFLKNLEEIDRHVKEYKPDVIVNFYDLLCGLYFLNYKPKVKHVTIAHQYLLPHPHFETPRGKWRDKQFMALNNGLTSFRADKRLALSFREMSHLPKLKTFVVPPLLRQEVKDSVTENKDFLLTYVLNEGYGSDIIKWHEQKKNVEVHGFWDRKDVENEYKPHENITFHKLNDKKFLDCMKSCRAYASTSGFESICEAMFLGKPVMLVPTGGHFEQECNAIDAVKAGAGVASKTFDLQVLLDYLPTHVSRQEEFKKWALQADEIFLKYMEEW